VRWIVLVIATGVLATGLALRGGVWPQQWNWCAAALALAGCVAWIPGHRAERAPRERWTTGLAAALIVWMALGMVPLPGWLTGLVSPMRMEIARAAGETAWVPLSVGPAKTFEWLLAFAPAVLMMLLARELAWWWRRRMWVVAAPLIILGAAEAALGLVQFYLARMAGGEATPSTGSFANRNHFAGLLEMTMPLAVAGALAAWRSGSRGQAGSALRAVGLLASGVAMLLAIVCSQSRMGFLAALGALAVGGTLALTASERRMFSPERTWRAVVATAGVAAVAICAFVYLPTDELVRRFATLAQTEEISQDTRAQIWHETGMLIRAFPVTGVGLGTYESAFRRYKTVAPENTVDFAHNDYLQALAELGIVGCALGIGLLGLALARVLKVAAWRRESRNWELALGLAAAITAMLLHSLVDFNMYIPTNALTMGWICGLAASPALEAD